MKFYFKNQEEERSFSIKSIKRIEQNFYKFKFTTKVEDGENTKELFLKKIANKLFCSENGRSWEKVSDVGRSREVTIEGIKYVYFRGYRPSTGESTQENALITKMPGKVIRVLVEEGESVNLGQPLLIVEAMKMENEIRSNKEGIVSKIHIKENQTIESGVLMLEIDNKE